MKKVRAYIIVDLSVADDLTSEQIKELVGVGRYTEYQTPKYSTEKILLKGDDFEVEEYVDIGIENKEE